MAASDPHADFHARAEAALERDEPAELAELVPEIGREAESRDWAQSCCVQLARHRSAEVRAGAILGLAHLARRFGHLDPGRVRRLVDIALHDPSPLVRHRAADAADDFRTFLGWEFETPDP